MHIFSGLRSYTKGTLHKAFAVILLTSSGIHAGIFSHKHDDRGEAIGILGRPSWRMSAPLNMSLLPGGTFMMGPAGEDPTGNVSTGVHRQVTLSPFFMDEALITNNQYRQFILSLLENATDSSEEEHGEAEEKKAQKKQEKLPEALQFTTEFIATSLQPDPAVWQKEPHHMGDPMLEHYFDHPAFDHYPVVGVTWEAARTFAQWRTAYMNRYRASKNLPPMPAFRLATCAEFEYASRGGHELAKYPWGGPYTRDSQGNLLANFKSGHGNYAESGHAYTCPVRSFPANDFGLYDMAGNAACWLEDSFGDESIVKVWDLNPVYINPEEPKKATGGGSWASAAYYMRTGVFHYMDKDSKDARTGFRCVMPCFGTP